MSRLAFSGGLIKCTGTFAFAPSISLDDTCLQARASIRFQMSPLSSRSSPIAFLRSQWPSVSGQLDSSTLGVEPTATANLTPPPVH